MIETLLPNSSDSQPETEDRSNAPESARGGESHTGVNRLFPQTIALTVVAIALGWAFAPNLRSLVTTWNQDPNYSHGFLVIPVALVILWQRWMESGRPVFSPSWWGWLALVLVLGLRSICYERGAEWSETATLLPVIACLALTAGGWPLFRRVWPAIAFLVFLLPLPKSINGMLSQPLQHLATVGSCILLKLTGLWVVAEGNVILVGADPLEVAAACNGLSMLMCLAATVVAMTILVPMDNWKRVCLLISIIPIALLSNILRISATAWCYHLFGASVGGHFAHDAAGWLMMPVALALVGIELGLLSFLVAKTEELPVQRPDLLFGGRSSRV